MTVETVFSLAGSPQWPQALVDLSARARRKPFDPLAIDFVATLSSHILRSPSVREHPELAALAHWFRRANLQSMAERFRAAEGVWSVRPRGLVFILAPANVEVLFAYAWLLSLLAGNGSIIRVSQKASPIRDEVIRLVRELVGQTKFGPVLADSWVVTYGHDDAITTRISMVCDARLVWGGDATVSRIRAIPIKPLAVEAGFADRFSFAAFSVAQVHKESDDALRELARKFANDTLWSAQQACSSPRAVFWVGDADQAIVARERFWSMYAAAAAGFENEPAAVMSRVTDLFMLAGVGAIDQLTDSLVAFPARASGSSSLADVREIHSGHGLFVEYIVTSVDAVAPYMVDKDQTMVVHGFDDHEIETLLDALPSRAIDRIVLPGQATEFSRVWDGSDMFDILLRKVNVSQRRTIATARV